MEVEQYRLGCTAVVEEAQGRRYRLGYIAEEVAQPEAEVLAYSDPQVDGGHSAWCRYPSPPPDHPYCSCSVELPVEKLLVPGDC